MLKSIFIVFPPAPEVCAHIGLAGTLLLYMALRAGKVRNVVVEQVALCFCVLSCFSGRVFVMVPPYT